MKAEEKALDTLLKEEHQLIIPIYQRSYNWIIPQCQQLWDDIVSLMKHEQKESHFIGSIVRIKKSFESEKIPKEIIIDGQQRITTVTLIILALIQKVSKATATEPRESYLINRFAEGELRYKLKLSHQDNESLISLIEDRSYASINSDHIKENFNFFSQKIDQYVVSKSENFDKNSDIYANIFTAIRKLAIVDITLDPTKDNSQLIFESLNSTGLALSQTDLIRNYVLMNLDYKHQENLYLRYWYTMEKNFGSKNYTEFFDRFIRDYLIMKTGGVPNINKVYITFKKYCTENNALDVDSIIADVYKYSNYYVNMMFGKEENKKLNEAFSDINDLQVNVAYPFLLSVYDDYAISVITEKEFLEILYLIQSYVFRRFICDLPTNSLNKIFAALKKKIDPNDYVNSFKAALILFDGYRRFPNNGNCEIQLKEKNLYKSKNISFWLRKFENYNRKEPIQVTNYTIEHIMPQNKNLSENWKNMLGVNWSVIQDTYLHTLGNLTLTGYNTELSDKDFSVKKSMKGGFDKSPLQLNESLRDVNIWDEKAILNRTKNLIKTLFKIFPYPSVSESILEKYKKKPIEKKYNLNNYSALQNEEIKNLFDVLRKRILNIDIDIKEEFLKQYIAYKVSTNFVDVIPMSIKLKLILNVDYGTLDDPTGICLNMIDKGHWGNGDVEIHFDSLNQLEDVMHLIQQSYDVNI